MILGETLCDKDPLALASREMVKVLRRKVGDPGALHCNVHRPSIAVGKRPVRTGLGIAAHGDHLANRDGQGITHLGRLEDVGNPMRPVCAGRDVDAA